VAGKIRDGELSEYHFVTNGKFSGPFKEYIDTVNDALVAAGGTPISYHEGVTTLSDDPWAGERPD
jgi:hypothetical protein